MVATFHVLRPAGFVAAILAAASLALAQEQQNPRRQAPRRGAPRAEQRQQQPGQQRVTANKPISQSGSADHSIAQCLAIDNQEEIALARIAASKSQDKKVREFADTLIKDHTELMGQLQRFAEQIASLDDDGGRRAFSNVPVAPKPTATEQPQGQPQQGDQAGGLNFLDVKRQVAQMCLANAQREWSEKKPGEAEQCYLAAQVVAHQKMIDVQKVLRQYASADLQAVLDKGIETGETHLDRAKQLLQARMHGDARADRASDSKREAVPANQ